MTRSLLDLIPSKAVDVVGIYDEDFNQLFDTARPVKASVKAEATFFNHPLESSATRTDHIIFNPVEISLSMILSGDEYRNVYAQIKQSFLDQAPLIIQTRADTYQNMYIQGIPHDETPDAYDAIILSFNVRETQVATTEVTFLPEAQADTSTKNRGQQEPRDTTDSEEESSSFLFRWFGS